MAPQSLSIIAHGKQDVMLPDWTGGTPATIKTSFLAENYRTSPHQKQGTKNLKTYIEIELVNSTLYIFRIEGLEMFGPRGVYLNRKGFLTPTCLNKSTSSAEG